MSLIIKRAQHNFYDCFDADAEGWEENHTRVKIIKRPGMSAKVCYHSGKPLPKIRYVEIAKSV